MSLKSTRLLSMAKTAAVLLLGAFMCAIALNVFFLPSQMTMGGITGIASIIYQSINMPIPFGVFVGLVNLPLFIIGGLTISKKFIMNTIIGTVVYSLMIDLTEPMMSGFYQKFLALETSAAPDLFLVSIFGGVLYGVGLGLMLYSGYTTGGTDILAILIKRKLNHISLGQIIWVTDALIIASSAYFYRNSTESSIIVTLYSAIAVWLTSKGIDFVVEGFNFQRTAFIISSKSNDIANRIMFELDRGLTSLKGNGMYTGKEQNVLMCVLSKEQIGKLKQIVSDEDQNAFVLVMDTREVLGEGFSNEQYMK